MTNIYCCSIRRRTARETSIIRDTVIEAIITFVSSRRCIQVISICLHDQLPPPATVGIGPTEVTTWVSPCNIKIIGQYITRYRNIHKSVVDIINSIRYCYLRKLQDKPLHYLWQEQDCSVLQHHLRYYIRIDQPQQSQQVVYN